MAWLVGVYLRETRRVNEDGTVMSLALLFIRGAENATSDIWRNLRHEPTPDGRIAQRSATTPGQQHILRALDLRESPKFFDVTQPAD